jgi:hypothetical protein
MSTHNPVILSLDMLHSVMEELSQLARQFES